MKRTTALLLALMLLLCGCGKKNDLPPATEPTQQTTTPTTVPTQVPTTVPTQVSTQAPTQAPTVAPTVAPTQAPTEAPTETVNRHPLTGAVLEQPWSGQIVAVMVNNIRDAMPQYGLSQADIIYEIEEESGVTRNMVLFSNVSALDKIGSIRSARTYFVSVAAAYDAYLVHCGTSNHAAGGGYDYIGNRLRNWKDIDQFSLSSYFYRDSDRYNDGYAWEHTLFTTGDLLKKALEKKGVLSTPKVGTQFTENVILSGGTDAKEITVKFKGGKTTTFTYDAATGLYTRSQYGVVTVDAANNETVKVKNVIALYTDQWRCSCKSDAHQYYDTIGSGEGYAAVNGKLVPIKWSRASVNDPYVYTLEDGKPLQLDVGSTYIAVVGIKHPLAYK